MAELARLPASATGLGLVALLSIPALRTFVLQTRKGAARDNFYQDRDGKSTPEAIASFSNRRHKIALLLSSVIGLATSVALSVVVTLDQTQHKFCMETWLNTASWILIQSQATLLFAIHAPVEVHDTGFWIFLSCLITGSIASIQTYAAIGDFAHRLDVALILRAVNVGAAVVTLLSSILIPRRPKVFFRDEPVDSQWTTSVLSRGTWGWPRTLMDKASKQGDLEERDIPQPDHLLRVDEVMVTWNSQSKGQTLLRDLWTVYRGRILLQWTTTILRCVFGVIPFWVMLDLVQRLTDRGGDAGAPSRELCGLVVLLGLVSMAEQWADSWVSFYAINMLMMPMRAQLSALIYEKSLRRKNVKSAEKTKEGDQGEREAATSARSENHDGDEETPLLDGHSDGNQAAANNGTDTNPSDTNGNTKKTEDQKPNDSKPEDTSFQSRQSVVNLVGIDTRRISNFMAMQFFIVASFGKLIFYSIFLIQLIGWIPFVVGILAWALVLPINTYFSKRLIKLTAKIMTVRDKKLAIVNEALQGIRQIKFAALEGEWESRINGVRDEELGATWTMFLADVGIFGCWVVSPILLAAASLATYALIEGELTPPVAFVSISVFKALEVTLGALPELLTGAFETLVSIRRVDSYLKGPEMKQTVSEGPDVGFEDATISWPVDEEVPDEERFLLKNLNLTFPAGELSVITGKTGTGKSLILSALIGESDLVQGKIRTPPRPSFLERNDLNAHPGNWILPGSVAFIAQTPWLESASLRDNILFGLPFVKSRYHQVLRVCALKKDLDILTDGDKTELGANGINLSGGQKWRITLARAIYSRAEILIMDDIFSAVDAHVGRQIFEECISGPICKGRTRILVTHHVGLVQSKAKFFVELGEEGVLHSGLTSELAATGVLQEIKNHEQTPEEIQEDEATGSSTAVASEAASTVETPPNEEEIGDDPDSDADAKKFIQDETREKGMVKSQIYSAYIKASGGVPAWLLCVLIYTAFEGGNLARSWWVRIWTGSNDSASGISTGNALHPQGFIMPGLTLQEPAYSPQLLVAPSHTRGLTFYLGIYCGLSLAAGIIGTVRFWWAFWMSIMASRTLFRETLGSVLRTPLRWLDTVPVGRILNRLTSDFETIDQRLSMNLGMLVWHLLSVGCACIAASMVSAYVLLPASVLIVVAGVISKKYLDGARPFKRLESTSKSPVFELFNATLNGISTLRAFEKTTAYNDKMNKKLDLWDSVTMCIWSSNRWLSFRTSMVGTVFTTIIGFVVIFTPGVDGALAGFALSFALDFTSNILWTIRSYSQLELDMNAAERVIEYSKLQTESQEGQTPPASWPTSGKIEVKDLVIGYAENLPAVLKGITFDVRPNERIGVVGRTGAGKSSLTLGLFRFLEPRSGSVHIDGVDTSKIDLHTLRSRLSIIPQDPVLFSGTIRSNLDPFNHRSDEELKTALARAHLIESGEYDVSGAATPTGGQGNSNVFKDLSSPVSESGGNFSQGQRQLLCLARAIVSRPKVMVLDEATSAVDMKTDALIQRSIREEFTSSTLIVIAHRLSTVIDFDRILVLSGGEIAEYGTPRELWEKEGGLFREMCENTGEPDLLREKVYGGK